MAITVVAASITARMIPQQMLSVTGTGPAVLKKRSQMWQMMSVTPAAVWYCGSVNVTSGSSTATRGRNTSPLTPFFRLSASLLMTHDAEASEPAAGMVSTQAIGRHAPILALWLKKSHTSPW